MTVLSHEEAKKILRRVGFTPDRIDEIFAQLPDPFDIDRDRSILERNGVTRGVLVDLIGGSP